MKLDTTCNEAILSNVGSIGEFKIRNSAKAFKILSDGLYSNKIRAIIRELSCNAVDSHVAAGKKDVPFEVHLPTILEPWFAVRDFGTGLNDHQVVNIYTTYFESTKTSSNDFIGALGLGSKSPFSYTENFTVTAIKDGVRRIYSAFINDQGVPSIAQMSEEVLSTTDKDGSNGVEVKFSVTDRQDYQSFRNEAIKVFAWFEHKPIITGVDNFQHQIIEYAEKNIVPGVHSRKSENNYHRIESMALMGNIAYPLNNIPDPHNNIGKVSRLLECGLVLECDIGELDFAASREQLSYIPSTLNTIKGKLDLLNANLAKHLAVKADAIKSEWDRAFYLYTEYQNKLYTSAVEKYVIDTKFPLFDVTRHAGAKIFELNVEDLTKRGLQIHAFRSNHGSSNRLGEDSLYIKASNGQSTYFKGWKIPVHTNTVIVLNDLKTGCGSRARYHFNLSRANVQVFCISHSDSDLSVRSKEYEKLIKELHNPPRILKASELEKPVRAKTTSSQGIMHIRTKANSQRGYADSYMWDSYTETLDDNETYYYVALNNYDATTLDGLSSIPVFSIQSWIDECGIAAIQGIKILGVRKSRINEIKELGNWVWFEDKLKEETAKISDKNVMSMVVAEMLDSYYDKVYTNKRVANLVGQDSDYAKYVAEIGGVPRLQGNIAALVKLCGDYGKSIQVHAIKKKIEDAKKNLYSKYPLLKLVREGSGDIDEHAVADYIKMVDKQFHT